MMERSQILETMGELKLYGMKAAYDEIIATAVKRQHEPHRIVGDLLSAEISEKQARSIKYQITIVNAARNFPKSAEVKFPSSAAQGIAEVRGFFGGRPRGLGAGAMTGGVMLAFDRTCSGMSSACWRRR